MPPLKLQAYLDAILKLQPKKQALRLADNSMKRVLAQFRQCARSGREVQAVAWMYVMFAHMATSDEPVLEDCVKIAVHCATFGLYLACLANDRVLELKEMEETGENTTLLVRNQGFLNAWDTLRGFMQAASRAFKQERSQTSTKQPPTLQALLRNEQDVNTCFGLFLASVLALAHRVTCGRQPFARGIVEVFAVLATVAHTCSNAHQQDTAAVLLPRTSLHAVNAAKHVAALVLDEFQAEAFVQVMARQRAALKAASVRDRYVARETVARLQSGSTATVSRLCLGENEAPDFASMLHRMVEYCGQQLVDERTQRWNPMFEPAHGMYYILSSTLDYHFRRLDMAKRQRQHVLLQSTATLSDVKTHRANKQLPLDVRLNAAVTEAKHEVQKERLEKLAQMSHYPLSLFSPVTRRTAGARACLETPASGGTGTASSDEVEIVTNVCTLWSAEEQKKENFLAMLDASQNSARSENSLSDNTHPARVYAQLILKQKADVQQELEKAEARRQQKHVEEMKRHRQLRVAQLRAQRDERKAKKAESIQMKKQREEQLTARSQMSARRETSRVKEFNMKMEKELNRVRAIKARKKLLEDNERTLQERREVTEAERRARWQAQQEAAEQGSSFSGSLGDDDFDDAQLEEELRRQEAFEERVQHVRETADSFANRLNRGRFLYVNGKPSYMDNVFPDPEPGYLYVPPTYVPAAEDSDEDGYSTS